MNIIWRYPCVACNKLRDVCQCSPIVLALEMAVESLETEQELSEVKEIELVEETEGEENGEDLRF